MGITYNVSFCEYLMFLDFVAWNGRVRNSRCLGDGIDQGNRETRRKTFVDEKTSYLAQTTENKEHHC